MRLTEGDIERRLRGLAPGWKRDGDELEKKFEFEGFGGAMAFVNRVAAEAEAMDHHPDIKISYNRVKMTLSTHSEGGVTDKDFGLAARIDRVAGSAAKSGHAA